MAMWSATMSMCGPSLTEKTIVISAGLQLIGTMLGNSEFAAIFNGARKQELQSKRSKPHFSDGMIASYFALGIANGSTVFEALNMFNDQSEFIIHCLGEEGDDLPSCETVRQRLELLAAHNAQLIPALYDASMKLLRAYGIRPTPMGDGRVVLDFDVTPFNNSKTKKEGVSRTYAGYDGLAPMIVYMGLEGYMIEAELREGKQHSQKGTPELLERVLQRALHLTTDRLLVRMDSGNDSMENMQVMFSRIAMGQAIDFIIKRNLRKETKDMWYNIAINDPNARIETPREGKRVYTGSIVRPIDYIRKDFDSMAPIPDTANVRIVYRVTERTIIAKTNQICLIPELEVETYWAYCDDSDEDVIELYHKHGTMEQFHSELKTDMDVERLPSGKFAANALVLAIAAFVYNLERMIGQQCCEIKEVPVKQKSFRRRLRSVLLYIIHLPAAIVHHARTIQVKVSTSCSWSRAYLKLWERFMKADRFTRPVTV